MEIHFHKMNLDDRHTLATRPATNDHNSISEFSMPAFRPPPPRRDSFYWQAGQSLEVGGRSLRKTEQRERRLTAASRDSSSWPDPRPGAPHTVSVRSGRLWRQRKKKRTHSFSTTPKYRRTTAVTSARFSSDIWTSEGRIPKGSRPGYVLPVPEEEFLEDMLSENPRFPSKSQRQRPEYWEEAAAALPVYRGPWQQETTETATPAVSVLVPTSGSGSSPSEFDFYH
ncbi:uncharacterized protein LOC121570681 [Coregonus clupeaformis]|uniref:uncharacterized protein LOC121570681 n=1 Tax=Coregonus clupeaformis TaxID=59861 RepID=UPI001BE0339D|nr:uncharacterized protein LOC121570681 [Coregonus clupeaformis]